MVLAFSEMLMKSEDWLYDHFEATKVELDDKLLELKKVGDPVVDRAKVRENLKEDIPQVYDLISKCRGQAANPSADFEHIPAEKKKEITDCADELESWMNGLEKKHNAQELYEDSCINTDEVIEKCKGLQKITDDVMNIPKPEPPKEEEAPPAADQASTEGEHDRVTGHTSTIIFGVAF